MSATGKCDRSGNEAHAVSQDKKKSFEYNAV
jgi:hypothetical protein